MRTAQSIGIVAALLLLISCAALADTYVVNAEGTGDFVTIQEAVDAADDGDIIELANGAYRGDGNRDVNVPSENITIRSQSGDPEVCYIDCEGSARAEHRGFTFSGSPGRGDATLWGVGVFNGYVTGDGGAGILIAGASPTLEICAVAVCVADGALLRGGGLLVTDGASPTVIDCFFFSNTAGYGGGIAVYQSAGYYEGCQITDNVATHTAGGVYAYVSGSATFMDCLILSNDAPRAGGAYSGGPGSVEFTSCSISRNGATSTHSGGIWLQTGTLNNCTLIDNEAATVGGGVYCGFGTGLLQNCLIAFTGSGDGVAADEAANAPTLTCCNVYGNQGTDYGAFVDDQTGIDGTISEDPRLCDLQGEDYTLDYDSPCLPGGNGCGVQIGAYGQGCDTPVEASSWGRVKALYR